MLFKLKLMLSFEFWIVLVLFFIGLFIRLYHLGIPSLVDDEIYTAVKINHSLLDTIGLLRHWEFPPLHYVVLNLWTRVFGNSEWALRLPSAIFSSLTIIVIYKIGKELFSTGTGIIAAALLVFSPFAINYAQNAKMYALFWFLTALSFLFFFRFLKDQKNESYWLYIIVAILSCFTMYTGFLFLATQSIMVVLMEERTSWKKWFAGQSIVISFSIPWLIYFLCASHEHWSLRPPGATFDYFTFLVKTFLIVIGSYGEGGDPGGLGSRVNCFFYIFFIAFLFINAISYQNKRLKFILSKDYRCLCLWMVIPVVIYFLLDYFFIHSKIAFRYIGFLQVPIILLVSGQINNLNVSIRRIVLVIIMVIAMNHAYLYFKEDLRFPPQDWRRTAEELTQDLGQHDIVLSFLIIPGFKYYYKGDTGRFFNILQKDCSSEYLVKNGILSQHIHSIFVLYQEYQAPVIQINGFSMADQVSNGGIGYTHFLRIKSKSNVNK